VFEKQNLIKRNCYAVNINPYWQYTRNTGKYKTLKLKLLNDSNNDSNNLTKLSSYSTINTTFESSSQFKPDSFELNESNNSNKFNKTDLRMSLLKDNKL
jgi:hypothetical protein